MFLWTWLTKTVVESFADPVRPPQVSGGAEVIEIDRGGKALFARMDMLGSLCVDIGFFKDTGTHPESGMPMAQHAAELVFGDPDRRLPPRDFMTSVVGANRDAILQTTKDAVVAILNTKTSPTAALKTFGEFYEYLMKENIFRGTWAPLHWTTVLKKIEKGSAHANDVLLDTEAMVDSISFKVRRPV